VNLIQSTLVHKILPARQTSGERSPALILLHGRGANEDDLLGLAEHLDARYVLLAARAPFDFQWSGGFTWYDILEVGRPEPAMFAESYRRLSQFFEDVKKGYPIDPSRVFFLGFSMGTMMLYCMALTKPGEVAGVVANSGYIPEDTGLNFLWDRLGGTSFFIAHGVHDPVIPVQMGRRAKHLLEEAKADLVYREYPMAHEISEDSLNDLAEWLTRKLDKA